MTLAKLAVGVDFSPGSLTAMEHAMEIARHTGATLTMIHVAAVPEPRPGSWWRAPLLERLAERRADLAALRERFAGQGVELSQVVFDGYVDTGIAEAAHAAGAELIVIGTHGRTGFRRVMLGSVAEKTTRLADASVLVARGAPSPGGYRRVVVGTDYSPLAERALERALELTAPGGDVQVVHAWAAPYLEYDLSGEVLEQLRAEIVEESVVQRTRILAMPRPPDVDVHLELADGTPLRVLEERSASADLIVVGTHGRRGVRRLLLGSEAEATVRHARCSVLVAR